MFANWLKKGILASIVVALGVAFPGGDAFAFTISGTVSDIASGAAVAVPTGVARAVPDDPATPPVEGTITDGVFTIDNVPDGLYRIEFAKAGEMGVFISSSTAPATTSPEWDAALPFDIDADITGLTVELDSSTFQSLVTVTGAVTLAEATSMGGTDVRFWNTAKPDAPPVSKLTDPDGSFSIDLQPDSYEVEVIPAGKAPVWVGQDAAGATTVELDRQNAFQFFVDATTPPTINLAIAASDQVNMVPVSGTFTRSDNSGLADATVRFWPAGAPNPVSVNGRTNGDGFFSFDVPPGSYEIEVQPDGFAPFFIGEMNGEKTVEPEPQNAFPFFIDASFTFTIALQIPAAEFAALVPVTGTISKNDGSSVANAQVRFWPSGKPEAQSINSVTNANGVYNIDVAPGGYKVEIQPVGSASVWVGQTSDGNKVVEANRQEAFSFFVDAGTGTEPPINGTISLTINTTQIVNLIQIGGVIQRSDTTKVSGADVRFYPFGVDDPLPIVKVTDANGAYSVKVPPGNYGVEVQVPGKAPVVIGLNPDTDATVVKHNPANAFPFFVGEGSPWLATGINLTLGTADLKALVTAFGNIKEAGVNLAGAEVAFVPGGVVDPDPIVARTGTQGNYQLLLPPGGYRVEIWAPGKAPVHIGLIPSDTAGGMDTLVAEQNPENAFNFFIDATSPWTASTGSGISIDIPPGLAQSLVPVFGTITEGGVAAPGVEVGFLPSGMDDAHPVIALTDGSGHYEIGLAPGGYEVGVALPGKAPLFLNLDVATDGTETVVVEENPEHAFSFFIDATSPWVTGTTGISADIPTGLATALVPTYGTITTGVAAGGAAPAPGAEVAFFPAGVPDSMPIVALTNFEGKYDIGLAPGAYEVVVQVAGKAPVFVGLNDMGTEDINDDMPVVVPNPDQSFPFFIDAASPWNTNTMGISLNVDTANLQSLKGVTGTITVGTTPTSGIDVRFWPIGPEHPTPIHTVTDNGGMYDVSLAPGLFMVEVQLPGKAPVFVGLDPASTATAPVTVPAANPEDAHIFAIDAAGTWSVINLTLDSANLKSLVNVNGQVRKGDMALPGAEVRIWPEGVENPMPFKVLTNKEGRYAVQVPPGLYKVEVEEPGFVSLYPSQFDRNVLTPDVNDAFVFDVKGASIIIDILLDPAMAQSMVQISGMVTRDGTAAIQGARVVAVPEDPWLPKSESVTGPLGRFKMEVPPGRYKIKLAVEGFVGLFPTSAVATTLTKDPAQAFVFEVWDDLAVNLNRGTAPAADIVALANVSGVVSSTGTATGTPVQGAEVIAHSQDFPGMAVKGGTRDDGSYFIKVPPGDYIIELRVDGYVRATPSADADPAVLTNDPDAGFLFNITASRTLNMIFDAATATPAVPVHGTVSDDHGPIMGAHVMAYQVVVDAASGNETLRQPPFEDGTGPEGDFRIDVVAGSYKIKVEVPGFQAAFVSETGLTPEAAEARVFTVDATTASTPIVIVLTGGGGGDGGLQQEKITISGTVTKADATGARVGIPGLQVGMQPEWDPNSATNGAWEQGITDSNGKFSIDVIPGKYRVEVMTRFWDHQTQAEVAVAGAEGLIAGFAYQQDTTTRIWSLTKDWEAVNIFSFSAPTTVNLGMTQGKTVSGMVMMNDSPVAGVEINVHSIDFQDWFWAQSQADGSFSVSVTPGKNYVVEVWPRWCDQAMMPAEEFATCQSSRVEFMGGNFIVNPEDTRITRNAMDEPVITAGAATGTVNGAVLAIWEPQVVTQFTVNDSLVLGVLIDAGTQLTGTLVDGSGNGIANAWVDSDFGGAPTGADGTFTLNIPTSSEVTNAKSTFEVRIWPPWCDEFKGREVFEACQANKVDFIGGVVSGSVDGGFRISTDWESAADFKTDGTDWPSGGMTVTASSGVSITGTVKNDGVAMSGVWVDAWSHTTFQGNGAETDANGNFAIRVETPASGSTVNYEVHIWSPDYIPPKPVLAQVGPDGVTGVYAVKEFKPETGPVMGEPIDIDGVSGTDTTVLLSLSTGNTISGRVVDASGKGIAWTWVDIHTKDFTSFFGTGTDQEGNYSISVPPGQYIAVVWGDGGNLRTTWYNQATNERDATLVDVTSASKSGVNFRMTSGSSLSGTITSATADGGKKVWLNLHSEASNSWKGKEVTLESDGSTAFTISGLNEASDYRLDLWGDGIRGGFYGGTLGAAASRLVNWEKATKLDTRAGNLTGANIDVNVTTTTLTLTVTGLQSGEKADGGVWSDTTGQGGWNEATANASGVATVIIKGLDASGTDYKLFVGSAAGTYKVGNYKGTPVTTTDTNVTDGDSTETTAGTLVDWERATRINMAANKSVKVAMDSGGAIAGTVSGLASGKKAFIDAWSESKRSWAGTEVTAGTDGTATYTLKGLERADDFRVSINGEGVRGGFYSGTGTLAWWEDAAFVDISTANATGIDLSVAAGVSISGSVTGLQNGEFGWLSAWSEKSRSWAGIPINGTGAAVTYSLGGLASASDYVVDLHADGYVHQVKEGVDATTSKTGVDFTLSTGGKISGSITGLGAYERVWVDAWSPAQNAWGGVGVLADANGAATYTINGLQAASDYVVGLWSGPKGYFFKTGGVTANWNEHTDVAVTTETTSGIDFALANVANLFVSLSGTISGLPTDGNAWVEIFAWSEGSGGGWTSRIGNGDYTMEGLTAGGSYLVGVKVDGYAPLHTKSVTIASGAVSGTPVWSNSQEGLTPFTVSANTTGLNVTLSSGRSIKGTVSNTATGAVSNVIVLAWDNTNRIGKEGKTNSTGKYTIKGLPDGTYTLSVWTPDGSAETTVTVSGADLTGQNLSITKAAGGISGTVTDSAGVVKGGVQIIVYNANNEQVANTATSATGTYSVEGLANGTYTVEALGDANFSTTLAYKSISVTVSGAVSTGNDLQLSAAQ